MAASGLTCQGIDGKRKCLTQAENVRISGQNFQKGTGWHMLARIGAASSTAAATWASLWRTTGSLPGQSTQVVYKSPPSAT